MFNNNISNTDNYIKNNENNLDDVFKNYVKSIDNLVSLIVSNKLTSNINYEKYIIINGIKSISHIFNLLLLYTKNLDLTMFHVNRAYVYYIEFIGQIGDNNHTFLQLNSKDASIFIYKKTIYEIDEQYKKNMSLVNPDYLFYNKLDILISFYNNLIFNIINKNNYNINDIPNNTKNIYKKILSISYESIIDNYKLYNKLCNKLYNILIIDKILAIIVIISKNIDNKNINNINYNIIKIMSIQELNDYSNQRIVNILLRN